MIMQMRSIVLVAAVLVSAGEASAQTPAAGRAATAPARPRAIEVMSLTTAAWTDGGRIPVKHAQPGRDVSPPLAWTGAPEGTASFALMVHDIDAVSSSAGGGMDDLLHWMVWNIPASATSIAPGATEGGNRPDGSRQISASGPYYRGPAAPATGPAHHYVFEVYALDTLIDVPAVGASPAATRAAVLAAMNGHVRGKGSMVGLFRRAD
jgi:Raf kinase inhibitor-like YbhB/YbcL family protein